MKGYSFLLVVAFIAISANTSHAQKVLRCTQDNQVMYIITEKQKVTGFFDKQGIFLSIGCSKRANCDKQYYLDCTIHSNEAIGFAPSSSLLLKLGDGSVIKLIGYSERIKFDKIKNQEKDYTWNKNTYPISEEQLSSIGKNSIVKIRVQFSQVLDVDYYDKVITDGNTLTDFLMAEYVNIGDAIETMETTDITKDF